MKVCADPDTAPDAGGPGRDAAADLLKAFKPALLGRMTVVPYYPLGDEVLKKIIELKLKQIGDRLKQNHKATFSYTTAVVDTIAARCKEVESGARNVDHILTGTVLPAISTRGAGPHGRGPPGEERDRGRGRQVADDVRGRIATSGFAGSWCGRLACKGWAGQPPAPREIREISTNTSRTTSVERWPP